MCWGFHGHVWNGPKVIQAWSIKFSDLNSVQIQLNGLKLKSRPRTFKEYVHPALSIKYLGWAIPQANLGSSLAYSIIGPENQACVQPTGLKQTPNPASVRAKLTSCSGLAQLMSSP